MTARIHACRVVATRKLLEVLITSGYYVALAAGLALGAYLVTGFVGAVGSGGFDASLHPVYDRIHHVLTGAFGTTVVERVFSQGPFFLALHVAFFPVWLYLTVSSIVRFGTERNAGAVELLCYGPADGTSYVLACYVRDLVITLGSLLVLVAFFALAAGLNNLILGPRFGFAIFSLFFVAAATFAGGLLVAVLVDGVASSLTVFSAAVLVLLVVQIGSFLVAIGEAREVAARLVSLIGWVSPFYYWHRGLDAIGAARPAVWGLSLIAMVLLSAGLLAVCHLVLQRKGVRS